MARFADLETVDPLRMLAVAVVSMAQDDARHGESVVMGIEWVRAAGARPSWMGEIGVKVAASPERHPKNRCGCGRQKDARSKCCARCRRAGAGAAA